MQCFTAYSLISFTGISETGVEGSCPKRNAENLALHPTAKVSKLQIERSGCVSLEGVSVCVSAADVACVTLRQPRFNQNVPRQTHTGHEVMVRADSSVSVSTAIIVRKSQMDSLSLLFFHKNNNSVVFNVTD